MKLLMLSLLVSVAAVAQTYQLKNVATGLNRPVKYVALADKEFVVEQTGRILVLDRRDNNHQTYLDIRSKVYTGANEAGLLGLAFHPDFNTNGRLFVNYNILDDQQMYTLISEFRLRDGQIDPRTEKVILRIPQPYGNHNGGEVIFGPDGFLYIGMGDGGRGGDPHGHGQNRKTLLASILRIDVDVSDGDNATYKIPSDNPFINSTEGFRKEIFAYGLRNPWRFSFDPQTKELWVADVGQTAKEEINVVVNGGNYGWKIMEGTECYRARTCQRDGLILPIHEYPRSQGMSISGGHVYYGDKIDALKGHYIYGDYVMGTIWALKKSDNGVTNQVVLRSSASIVAFGVDPDGEIVVVDLRGRIARLEKVTN